ncbi:MAG: phage regulatory CII family protein [Alphaproteobacteria bacterium]
MSASSRAGTGIKRDQSSRYVQMPLEFAPGLTERHPTLLACCHESAVRCDRPMKALAADMDMSSSDLGRKLAPAEGDPRRLSVDDLVRLIDATGDLSPIYWLIEKFAIDDEARQRRAQAELAKQLPGLIALLKQVGVGS